MVVCAQSLWLHLSKHTGKSQFRAPSTSLWAGASGSVAAAVNSLSFLPHCIWCEPGFANPLQTVVLPASCKPWGFFFPVQASYYPIIELLSTWSFSHGLYAKQQHFPSSELLHDIVVRLLFSLQLLCPPFPPILRKHGGKVTKP